MMEFFKKFGIDAKLIKFGIVGVINTLFGTSIMFVLYNVLNCGYYFSSFCNYFFGSILSYVLNKYFTFNYRKNNIKTVMRFIINISVCYLVAYGICRPLARMIFSSLTPKLVDNIALLGGMCLFVLLNYFGQRYFVFKNEQE